MFSGYETETKFLNTYPSAYPDLTMNTFIAIFNETEKISISSYIALHYMCWIVMATIRKAIIGNTIASKPIRPVYPLINLFSKQEPLCTIQR